MIPDTSVPESYEKARAAYLRALKAEDHGMPLGRVLAGIFHAVWSRFPGHLSLLAAIALTFLVCRFGLAVEVPDRIVAAVAMIETGAHWKDTGNIKGAWAYGNAGEISHWQITSAVLDDLGLSSSARRKVATNPVYAESVFRLWYSRLLARTGSHEEALAAYHRGLGGRHRRDAREYARRVLNLSETL